MGKKARKTRWRTLDIADEQSDSEESNTTTETRLPKTYSQKAHYNKLPYSSQSTPRRRYQHDGTKSTRSSSTASETKITFNEDEYTRITTPRQDVLFKKGYLNKPRSYKTQTSTGTSTTSTGNSTGNGTPDHQSTDLEYESQFVFPNGFVDQNGIYYVNSFEPYPLMLYNPPTYYHEFSNSKSKRYSTGSLTESTSPNNEEATSQDLSGGEASNNVSDYSSHQSVYSMIYPDYYANGICPSQEMVNEHCPTDQPRKIKKRRRRKTSRSLTATADSTECSDDDTDEEAPKEPETENATPVEDDSTKAPPSSEPQNPPKYDLKPDAAEFVPRAYRPPEIPLQFIKVPPNFVHIPMVPFNPAFIPSGIPVHFVPPNFVGYAPDIAEAEPNVVATASQEVQVVAEEEAAACKSVDMTTVVSKLEEAVKEREEEVKVEAVQSPKYRNDYKRPRDSPQRKLHQNGAPEAAQAERKFSPEKLKKIWKPSYQNVRRSPDFKQKPPQNPRNYSATLRNGDEVKKSPTPEEAKSPKTATPNQWISVSSKKKRKNKNVEEADAGLEPQDESPVDDDFEAYDINSLVDVVPAPAEEVIKVEITEGKVEEIINTIAENLPTPVENNNLVANIRSVAEIESELIVKEPLVEVQEDETAGAKPKPKKKSRKGSQSATKRVIITDVDLSDKHEEIKTAVKKVAKRVEAVEEKPKAVEPVVVEEVIEAPIPPTPEEDDKKKSKKKKKKPTKPSSVTANAGESYDFLLETNLAEEVDKTNDEISQELDKIIQKGMYSNLEEKMKSLNIDESDGFFKSIFSKITTTRDSFDKTGYAKSPDFTKIPLFKPATVSEEHPLENKQSNTQLPASESPGEDGIFLDESHNLDNVEKFETDNAKDLYPITTAVKEWMSKTRETTPDIDILKSPQTIYKELHDSKTGAVSRSSVDDEEDDEEEEITVFATKKREDSEAKEDLLDFWENEVLTEVTLDCEFASEVIGDSAIDEGEDVLEVYESKYGKNEDYLNLQKEIQEETKNRLPKHNNLPYRAVCCNIM